MSYFTLIFARSDLLSAKSELTKLKTLLVMGIIWLASELFWNSQAFKLEIEGQNVFFELWIASIIFFYVNLVIVVVIIKN